MKGIIKTFIPEKNYGFIKGEDNKDYFFHVDAFGGGCKKDKIYDEVMVEFEPLATPKGYRAQKCVLINSSDIVTYSIPDDFPTSRSSSIKGWDIIEMGDWIVHGISRDSPDAAKRDLIDSAMRVGANALVEVEYYKTTESEVSDSGRGTYTFTIHNFQGRIATVAKKSFAGNYRLEQLLGMNKTARTIKSESVRKVNEKNKILRLLWSVLVIFFSIPFFVNFILGFVFIFIGIYFGCFYINAPDYEFWLVEKPTNGNICTHKVPLTLTERIYLKLADLAY